MAASDSSDTVKVAVRCRGLNRAEEDAACAFAINIHPVSGEARASWARPPDGAGWALSTQDHVTAGSGR